MSYNQTDTVIYPRKGTVLFIGLASTVFLLAGIIIEIITVTGRESMILTVIMLLPIGFFGLGTAYAVPKLISKRPAVILNRDGIFDDSSAIGAGLVRWEEIDGIFARSAGASGYVTIVLRVPEGVLSRQPLLSWLVMRLNFVLFGPIIFIPDITLPLTASELVSRIAEYRERSNIAARS